MRVGARAPRAPAGAGDAVVSSRRGSAVAASGGCHALPQLTDAARRADGAVARVLARAVIAEAAGGARRGARGIGAVPRRVAGERGGAHQPAALVARGDAQPLRAGFPVGTLEVRARIEARAQAALGAVRAHDAVAGAGALATAAHFAVGAADAAAQRIDAQPARRVARAIDRARELARLRAVRHALAVLAHLAARARRAVVDGAVAVVVEAVAALGARLRQRLAADHALVAQAQSLRADAFRAGRARGAAAAALHALDAGHQVGEVAVRAAVDVLPREVELQRRDLAVVDDQVNERIGPGIVVVIWTLRIIDIALAGGGRASYRRTAVAAGALALLRM